MAYKIIVKKRFTNKVTKLLDYLEKAWNKDVTEKFLELAEEMGYKENKNVFILKNGSKFKVE